MNVVQTLGSAWVDAFGPGIAQIVIAGHTGWAGGKSGPDWESQFRQLHEAAFKGWNECVEATKDPESVEVLFVDTLDSRVARVVPKNFTLRRNKSRPLLVQYNITFLVVRMMGGGGGGDGSVDESSRASFDQAQASMADSATAIAGMRS